MRMTLFVVYSPSLNLLLRIVKRQEPVQIQILVSKTAVERFDERIVRGFSGPREVEINSLPVSTWMRFGAACSRSSIVKARSIVGRGDRLAL